MHEAPSDPVHGIDGCIAGWLVATLSPGTPPGLVFTLHRRFTDVLACTGRDIAVIDIPIGLLPTAASGGRPCDREARGLLGRPRGNSVFSPPARPALDAEDYRDAIARNGAGMSRQAYNLLPKIREVERALTPARQRHVFEGHPELAFRRLAGTGLRAPKRRAEGAAIRRRLLQRALDQEIDPAALRGGLGRGSVAADDVLDAAALTLTACHLQAGTAGRTGAGEIDERGLEMAIRY